MLSSYYLVVLACALHSVPVRALGHTSTVYLSCLVCMRQASTGSGEPYPPCDGAVCSEGCGVLRIKKHQWMNARLLNMFLLDDWMVCAANDICSEQVVDLYAKRYATVERLGHAPTCEDFARIHVGGPLGFKKPETLPYWDAVSACLSADDLDD